MEITEYFLEWRSDHVERKEFIKSFKSPKDIQL